MANFFNADYYFAAKAKQLSNSSDGKTWTAAEVKAEFAKMGITPEQHYLANGQSEGLQPNAYFNETEYLESKLKALQEGSATKGDWTGKSVADLKAEFTKMGITAAEHYEKAGAFETRADGTLLNPSNAFDANAYFAAKLAQLQEAGFDGADTMTVQDVVNALKAAGASPVSHFLVSGAAEAKADGVPLVQTVPSEQRMPNDPGRTAFGENVPSNYNPPSKAPAAAVAAPVTKPADVGGLSAAAPAAPSTPVKVPGDAGYIAPPATLKDLPGTTIILPTASSGTGPNASFIVVDNVSGEGTVINQDGKTQGTIAKVEKDANGNFVQPKPETPITGPNGEETNTEPKNDNGDPVDPPTPVDPPNPEPPVVPAVLKFVPDTDPSTATTDTTLTLTKASNVEFTIEDGALKFKPIPGGTAVTLAPEFLNVKIGANVTLVGKGADFDTFLKNGASTDRTIIESTDAGKIEITDAKTDESYVGISDDLNVTAKVATDFTYADGNHGMIGTFDVAATKTLTGGTTAEMNGKAFTGAGNVTMTNAALAANTTINASAMTGSVTAEFTEGADEFTVDYKGGAGTDKVTLNLNGDAGTYDNLKAVVDLGAGDDMLVIDGTSATIGFAPESSFKGGVGNNDTLKVVNSEDVTALTSLDAFARGASGAGFDNLLLQSAGAKTYDFGDIAAGFTAVGFETGTDAYTLKNVNRKLIISNGDTVTTSTAVELVLDTAVSGDALTLEFKELDTLKAAVDQAELSAKLSMAALMNGKTLNVSGSAVNDLLTLTASGGEFANVVIDAAMGSGDDTVTIDLTNNTTGTLAFKADSEFDGGSGSDTLAVSGGLTAALEINFANLTLTSVENLDFSAVSGNGTHTFTLSGFGNAGTTFAVSGMESGSTAMTMGTGNDNITFTSDGNEATRTLTIDTGKGTDTVTLDASASGSDTITFTKADFLSESVLTFSATNADTITGFVHGNSDGDILNVSGFLASSAAFKTSTTLLTNGSGTFAANAVHILAGTDYVFDVTAESAREGLVSTLFGASGHFGATVTASDKAIVVIQGKEDSFVFYIENDGDAAIAANEIGYLGTLDGLKHDEVLVADNFVIPTV